MISFFFLVTVLWSAIACDTCGGRGVGQTWCDGSHVFQCDGCAENMVGCCEAMIDPGTCCQGNQYNKFSRNTGSSCGQPPPAPAPPPPAPVPPPPAPPPPIPPPPVPPPPTPPPPSPPPPPVTSTFSPTTTLSPTISPTPLSPTISPTPFMATPPPTPPSIFVPTPLVSISNWTATSSYASVIVAGHNGTEAPGAPGFGTSPAPPDSAPAVLAVVFGVLACLLLAVLGVAGLVRRQRRRKAADIDCDLGRLPSHSTLTSPSHRGSSRQRSRQLSRKSTQRNLAQPVDPGRVYQPGPVVPHSTSTSRRSKRSSRKLAASTQYAIAPAALYMTVPTVPPVSESTNSSRDVYEAMDAPLSASLYNVLSVAPPAQHENAESTIYRRPAQQQQYQEQQQLYESSTASFVS